LYWWTSKTVCICRGEAVGGMVVPRGEIPD
jgi:hypothetical protein